MMLQHRLSIAAALFASIIGTACSKDSNAPANPAPSVTSGTPASPIENKKVETPAALPAEGLVARTGVEPGAVQRSGASIAVVAEVEGKVEIRALGEPSFAPVTVKAPLFAG